MRESRPLPPAEVEGPKVDERIMRKIESQPWFMNHGHLKIIYSYPMWHKVSFTVVAENHIKHLKMLVPDSTIYEIDEQAFPAYTPHTRLPVFVHPAFYIMDKMIKTRFMDRYGRFRREYYLFWKQKFAKLVAVDVADSDRISNTAVMIANMFDTVLVPSTFARDAYVNSGVTSKVVVAQHGLDVSYYTSPNTWQYPICSVDRSVLEIYLYKKRTGKKVLLYWLWHSDLRKGWPEVKEFYEKLRRRRSDVVLVMKTGIPYPVQYQEVVDLGAINIYGWLDECSKMALYDLADINIMFSRGGAFEMNCLEALGRGVPCLAHKCCGWTDYLPDFLAVRKGYRVKPLPGNHIHVGYGWTVDVDDAVDRADQILDELDEYMAKVEEYRNEVLAKRFTWYQPALKMLEVLAD